MVKMWMRQGVLGVKKQHLLRRILLFIFCGAHLLNGDSQIAGKAFGSGKGVRKTVKMYRRVKSSTKNSLAELLISRFLTLARLLGRICVRRHFASPQIYDATRIRDTQDTSAA